MKITLSEESLPILVAIASSVRIKIIKLLSTKRMNVKELAHELGLSNPVVAKHIKILEESGVIKTEKIPGKAGLQKQSILKVDLIEIEFPKKIFQAFEFYETSIPIGQYVDYLITPTCGIASIEHLIGEYDEPKYFMDTDRFNAAILWFTTGFLEYKIINPLKNTDKLEMVDINLEISSEFPGGNNVWPSDITFSLNNVEIGTWTSPGDFVDTKGKYNPDWWSPKLNQYGTNLKIRITDYGVWINGKQLTWISFNRLALEKSVWSLRIEVKEDAENVGGCTLFGKGFGNYNQNIDFKFYYTDKEEPF
jgi:predicted transcriptional regulator